MKHTFSISNYLREDKLRYIYDTACHEDEQELCRLELRTLHPDIEWLDGHFFQTSLPQSPDRSPFVKSMLTVLLRATSRQQLLNDLESMPPLPASFKIHCLKSDPSITYEDRLQVNREVGATLRGTPNMHNPELRFGVVHLNGEWLWGLLEESTPGWLKHQNKPRQYSTALSARLARSTCNIAAPVVNNVTLLDPCCGIGTVLLEAFSMGMVIHGADNNPQAVAGARENLKHYGYPENVQIADMRDLSGSFHTVIIDLPYNLCSVLPEQELISMLLHAKTLAKRAVFLTVNSINSALHHAGWSITAHCYVHKSGFSREVIICECLA